jgi:peptide/nickel transport system substrate-binding protein
VGEGGKAVNKYVVENAWFAPFYRINQVYLYNDKKLKVTPQVQMAVPTIYNYEPVA